MLDLRNEMVLVRRSVREPFEDKTAEIESCVLNGAKIIVTYHNSKKSYSYSADRLHRMTGPRELVQSESIVVVDGEEWPGICSVLEFSNAGVTWVRLFRGVDSSYSRPASQVEVRAVPALSALAGDALAYWRRAVDALPPVDGSENPLTRPYVQFKKVHPESALAHILSTQPLELSEPIGLAIEPFSSNVSQREAVDIALRHRVSVIEGPPGTGKTQTILNLVASLIAEPGTSVGVVSANNAAIDNVAEKLKKNGYGFVVAELGNKTRRDAFYAGQEERNSEADRWLAAARADEHPGGQSEAGSRIETLNRLQGDERELRKLQDLLARHRHEFERFEVWLDEETVDLSESGLLAGRPAQRILTLLAESEFDTDTGPVRTWMRRLSRRIRFGDLRDVDLVRSGDVISLHRLYYERRIKELADEVERLANRLESAGMTRLLDEQAELSKRVLNGGLAQRYAGSSRPKFDQKDSGRNHRKILREYPVVVSTCHSLRASIGADTLLDVVIIDEASQLDLLSGALAMANCRNLVVVGDLQQLSHIPPELLTDIGPPPHTALDVTCHSVLSSLTTLYGSATPRTTLREHYRCDPAIIDFCNTKFYGGELIPYREGTATGPALSLVRTVEGNHMRRFYAGGFLNHREIDSITRELMPSLLTTYSASQIGIVSPYRKQAEVATTSLGESGADTESDTVHKYQGREKDVMIFTAVLDDSKQGQRGVKFVDDHRLVNVAVSRAVERFILVIHQSGLPESVHLRDLVGYIEFRNPEAVRESRLVSIFDLLYTSYASELRGLNRRILGRSKHSSENIAWTILEEILAEGKYQGLALSSQVLLRELVPALDRLTEKQASLVRNRASVDFVVRNAITRQPILAIEVDGYEYHENKPEQLARDAIKDSIFDALAMHLLRLPTTGYGEPDLIRGKLDAALADERDVKADR